MGLWVNDENPFGGTLPPRAPPLGVGARPPNPLRKDTLEGGWSDNFILGGFAFGWGNGFEVVSVSGLCG